MLILTLLALLVVFGSFLFIMSYLLIRPTIRGAVYYPTRPESVERMMRLANAKPGDRITDLGSGDGRILIAFAKEGIEAHGFEVNPILVWKSRRAIRRAGFDKIAIVCWQSFWSVSLDPYDIVTVFGIPHIMKQLKKKLERELKPGSRVVSNVFKFPDWKPDLEEKGVYRYVIRQQT